RVSHAAACLSRRLRQFRKKIRVQGPATVPHQKSQDPEEHEDARQRAKGRDAEHQPVDDLSSVMLLHGWVLPRRVVAKTNRRAAPLITMVSTKSTNPSSIRALRWR